MRLFVATGNAGKLREFQELCRKYFPEFRDVQGRAARWADETGDSFADNAAIKAIALRLELSREGINDAWILADDSGLCVDALEGDPGVRSARYAGADATDAQNVEKLLQQLTSARAFSPTQVGPRAHFRCALHLIDPQGRDYLSEGQVDGCIAAAPSGFSGFGYDPVFLPAEQNPPYQRSFAEFSDEEKNALSHRQRALMALATRVHAR